CICFHYTPECENCNRYLWQGKRIWTSRDALGTYVGASYPRGLPARSPYGRSRHCTNPVPPGLFCLVHCLVGSVKQSFPTVVGAIPARPNAHSYEKALTSI